MTEHQGNPPIQCLLFDLGGIVVPDQSQQIERAVQVAFSIPAVAYSTALTAYRQRLLTGALSLREFYQNLITELCLPSTADALLDHHLTVYVQTSTARNPEVLALLTDLSKAYLIACLTNTEREIAQYNRAHGLFDLFHKAYLSTELHLAKPQPEIFYGVCDDLHLPPEQILFLDDRVPNVEGALAIGMPAMLFDSLEQVKVKLRLDGILK